MKSLPAAKKLSITATNINDLSYYIDIIGKKITLFKKKYTKNFQRYCIRISNFFSGECHGKQQY